MTRKVKSSVTHWISWTLLRSNILLNLIKICVIFYVPHFVHLICFVHLQPVAMPDGNASSQNDHAHIETSGIQENHYSPLSQVTQTQEPAGHGGEGAEDRHGPSKMRRTTVREGMQQGWRDPSGKFDLDF